MIGIDVYLHEKDQFWPRQGSSDHGDKVPSKITLMDGKLKRAESLKSKQMIMKVEIAPGIELEGSFSVTRTKELGLQNPCTEEEGYSFTACISSYVDSQVFTVQLFEIGIPRLAVLCHGFQIPLLFPPVPPLKP